VIASLQKSVTRGAGVFVAALIMSAVTGVSAQSSSLMPSGYQSSSSLSDLESQAKSRGYSDEQIAAMKARYASQSTRGNAPQPASSPYFAEYTKPIASDDSLLLFSDSMSLRDISARDSVEKDTVAKKGVTDTAAIDTLPFFGYSVFEKTPDAFKPNAFGPVDPGYLAGPGDVLRLSVWGEVEFQYELKINREGKIFIPVAGQVYVAGIPYDKLQSKLQSILSKHYSGLASSPQKSFMDLSVAQIQPIRIFMMGEVKAPGGYTVATSSTAFNALYSVGGPLVSGSLREVTIVRDQKEIARLDLYQYLTTGRCSTDVRLLNDDIVFIPKRGKTVAVTGAVFKPAVYELKAEEQMLSLLSFCGGALVKRVRPFIERAAEGADLQVLDVDLKKLFTDSSDIPLYDNDTLAITPLADNLKNYATLTGAVHYPGVYQVEKLSLHALIFTHGKPIETRAFTQRADLVRLNPDMVTFSTVPIDLAALKADSAANDIMLQPYDQVIIYEKEVEKPTDLLITIEGEVRNPGAYTMSTNQTVVDALLRSGGFKREAFKTSVDLYRLRLAENGSDTITEAYHITLPETLDFNASRENEFMLRDRDKIVVRPNPGYITDNYVIIEGLVKFSGTYAIKIRAKQLSDIITRAGGLLQPATGSDWWSILPRRSLERRQKRISFFRKTILSPFRHVQTPFL